MSAPSQGEMAATPAGFAQLTHLLMGLAGGKLILSLEVSDPRCVSAHESMRTLEQSSQVRQEFLSQHFYSLAGQPPPSH